MAAPFFCLYLLFYGFNPKEGAARNKPRAFLV